MKVSYLIVGEADEDLEMAGDPFLEAGIDIPCDLPYVCTLEPSKHEKVHNAGIATTNALDAKDAFQKIQRGSIQIPHIVSREKMDQTKKSENSDGILTTGDRDINRDNHLTPNCDVPNNSR